MTLRGRVYKVQERWYWCIYRGRKIILSYATDRSREETSFLTEQEAEAWMQQKLQEQQAKEDASAKPTEKS